MSPMTRDRAGPGDTPTALMAKYYRQRSTKPDYGLLYAGEERGYTDYPALEG